MKIRRLLLGVIPALLVLGAAAQAQQEITLVAPGGAKAVAMDPAVAEIGGQTGNKVKATPSGSGLLRQEAGGVRHLRSSSSPSRLFPKCSLPQCGCE